MHPPSTQWDYLFERRRPILPSSISNYWAAFVNCLHSCLPCNIFTPWRQLKVSEHPSASWESRKCKKGPPNTRVCKSFQFLSSFTRKVRQRRFQNSCERETLNFRSVCNNHSDVSCHLAHPGRLQILFGIPITQNLFQYPPCEVCSQPCLDPTILLATQNPG